MAKKIPDPHLPVELHLLLGKKLREGDISAELAWRTWSFFHELYFRHAPQPGFHQVAMVSGAGGEATAVRVVLHDLQGKLYQPTQKGFIGPSGRGMQYLETEAPNSRLNIIFAVRELRKQKYEGPIRLHLYSSDYHLAGLLELRYKLPSISPFLFVGRGTIVDVIEKPSPYLFRNCGIAEYEWLSEIYLVRQGLRLAWENLRGITGVPGDEEEKILRELRIPAEELKIRTFLPESGQRVEQALQQFKKLLSNAPKLSHADLTRRVNQAECNVQSFIGVVGKHLQWLRQHAGKSIQNRELTEWNNRTKELEQFLNPTHIKDVDPDTAGPEWQILNAKHTSPEDKILMVDPPVNELLYRPACLAVDFDGTLAYFEDQEKRELFQIFARCGVNENAAKKYYDMTKSIHTFTIQAMVEVVKRHEGLNDKQIEQIKKEFEKWVGDNLKVYEESIKVLKKWLDEGYCLVILSVGDERFQKDKMKKVGISRDEVGLESLEICVVPDGKAKFQFLNQLPGSYSPVALIEDDPAVLDYVSDSMNDAELTESDVLTLRIDRPESPHFKKESEHGHMRFDTLDDVDHWLEKLRPWWTDMVKPTRGTQLFRCYGLDGKKPCRLLGKPEDQEVGKGEKFRLCGNCKGPSIWKPVRSGRK